jgi:tetratricopeptide (TPR) repeat protein/TolB-like protein
MTSSGILKELFRRRVPQILGVYLAAGWAVLEFTDFLVNRFVLSPHLIDFSMLAWVLLVPSVLMLAWYHGAPGRDKWTKFEKLGIPANLVVAAALLGAVFGGRDLGAATESVTVEDETGETVERTVPKGEFRKNIASFYFDNVSGDTALDWLQYGIPLTLQSDLAQDIFIGVRTAGDTRTRLREEGLADGLGVPLPLKRQIASQLHVAHFIAGDVTREAGRLAVTTRLYETRRGKLIQERTFSGDDLFALTDEMSVQLRRDLGIPTQVIEEGRDLPVSELLTESIPAYRSYVEAARASIMAEDLDVVVTHLEQAVAHDPQFADAHFMRFGLYFNLNRMDEARAAAQAGMQFIYKLPERSQFELKAYYYWLVRQEADRALAAAGMYSELYPEDIQAHLLLSQFRFARGEVARAVSALERVLELDPSRVDVLLDIGGMHEEAGEFDAALNNYERYAAASPNDPGAFIRLGRLHRTRGDHVAAKSQYERALIVDPDNVVAMTSIADIDRDLGSFESALRGYDEALAAAVTAEQRAGIYAAYEFYHGVRGQPNRAIDYMHRRFAEMEGYAGPFNTLQQKLQNLHTYVAAGQADVAKDTLASIAARLSPPNDVLLALGQLNLYLALEDADSVEAAIEGLDRFIEAWGLEYARPMAIRAQGRVLEIRGDCVEAIVSYRRTLELWPTSVEVALVDIGRCYRKLQRFDEAEDHLTRLLELRPYNPLAHYELGLVYADSGDREKALEHLRTALEVWSDADTVYKPAREAREKLAELSSTSL